MTNSSKKYSFQQTFIKSAEKKANGIITIIIIIK